MAGTLIAVVLANRIEPLLFQQPARDPGILAAVGLILMVVAVSAGLGPARRAARVDPNTALRSD